jgi:very-short-patch-repair endonuclease
VLARHVPGTTRTRNDLEEAFLRLVLDAGLPQPEVNVRVGPYEIDFLWREQGPAVETDGGASHARATQRERDSRRDAWLAAIGIPVDEVHVDSGLRPADEVIAAVSAGLK